MSTEIRKKRIIFMGTPYFSIPILQGLIDNYNVVAVVTQPDKKVGRKQEIVPSPIKLLAEENEIEVLQPAKIKDNKEFLNKIKSLEPDLIIVAAYGFILPQELLDTSKYGVINVHASLLPKYRGPSPIQSAILNGDEITGVTIMLINSKMDEGDILSQQQADIANNETFSTLHDKLSILGAHLLINTLPEYLNKTLKPQKQDDDKASYCKIITKDDGKINWNHSAERIQRQIRAFNPWPGSWTKWNNKKLKIISAKLYKNDIKANIGEVLFIDDKLIINCGQGALDIKSLQLEGKKAMSAKEFINGYSQITNQKLK